MNYNKNARRARTPAPPRAHDARDALARYAWARVACVPGDGVFEEFRPLACLLGLPTSGQISCRFSGKFGEFSGKLFGPTGRAILARDHVRVHGEAEPG